jgi:hypothetical protein
LAFATLEIPVQLLLVLLARQVLCHLPERDVLKVDLAYVLVPASFFSTVVMCQEEAMVAVFVLACSLLLHRERESAAAGLAILGVLSAKVFVALLPVIWLFAGRRSRRAGMSALAVLTLLYIPYALYIHGRTGLLPLLDCEMPKVRFCVSLTALVSQFWPLSPAVLRYGSFALQSLLVGAVLYTYRRGRGFIRWVQGRCRSWPPPRREVLGKSGRTPRPARRGSAGEAGDRRAGDSRARYRKRAGDFMAAGAAGWLLGRHQSSAQEQPDRQAASDELAEAAR